MILYRKHQEGKKFKNTFSASELAVSLGYPENTAGHKIMTKKINRNPKKYLKLVEDRRLLEGKENEKYEFVPTIYLDNEAVVAEDTFESFWVPVEPGSRQMKQVTTPQEAREHYAGVKAAEVVTDFLPGIGDIKGLYDLWEEYQKTGRINPIAAAMTLPVIGQVGDIAKVFKPVIKEYSSSTEMFLDFLKQAEQQGIKVNKDSKLYKQIVDEVPSARQYYDELDLNKYEKEAIETGVLLEEMRRRRNMPNSGYQAENIFSRFLKPKPKTLSDEQIADGLYLSTRTEQAQEGLRNSYIQNLVYHNTQNKFTEFLKDKIGSRTRELKKDTPVYDSDLGFFTYQNENFIPQMKKLFGEITMPLLISAQKPFINNVLSEVGHVDGINAKEFIENLKKQYDSTITGNEHPGKFFKTIGVATVPEPNQLKSPLRKHLGIWNWNDPNIHKAIGAGTAFGVGALLNQKRQEQKMNGGILFRKGGFIKKQLEGEFLPIGKNVNQIIQENKPKHLQYKNI